MVNRVFPPASSSTRMRCRGGCRLKDRLKEAPLGMPQPAASAQGKWSASDLIDPSMLPGWVRSNDAASPQANAARPGMAGQGMAGQDVEAPRERTGRVPAPREARPNAERDFGASRAGTAQRGPISRKHQAARPLGNGEKPAWLREDDPGGNGQPGAPAYPSGRPGQSRNGQSRNGYDDPGNYSNANGQSGQRGQRGQHGQTPAGPGQPGPAGQSWAAPDGYESSPWSRPRPTRHDAKTVAKKRKGGFFGFLRRG